MDVSGPSCTKYEKIISTFNYFSSISHKQMTLCRFIFIFTIPPCELTFLMAVVNIRCFLSQIYPVAVAADSSLRSRPSAGR